MKEAFGSLWEAYGVADAVCITTNGYVRKDGASVMGRGCAKQAQQKFPSLPEKLGNAVSKNGNIVHAFNLEEDNPTFIVSFPVKDTTARYTGGNVVEHMTPKFKYYDMVPGWALKANIDIITDSAERLVILSNTQNWESIALPRPGCGAGELSWNEVHPILSEILDDRFTCWTYKE